MHSLNIFINITFLKGLVRSFTGFGTKSSLWFVLSVIGGGFMSRGDGGGRLVLRGRELCFLLYVAYKINLKHKKYILYLLNL